MTVRKGLLQFLFSGSSMRRWNDKLRPVQLYEVDKQAHKMIVAFVLLELNSGKLNAEEKMQLGQKVIEGALFDYLYRLVITDIKPPVFYKIRENKHHFQQLTKWVLGELEPVVRPVGEEFWNRLCAFHRRDITGPLSLADSILHAAHSYASRWELQLILPFNQHFDLEMPAIEDNFNAELGQCLHLKGMEDILNPSSALGSFARICGQLRFQIRWSQTPRIPETSVLGHMFIVAAYAYLFSISVGACQARCQNNYFSGLFHDLPELLTRDIISPVKRSVKTLPSIIQEYEQHEVEGKILSPLRQAGYTSIVERLIYFLGIGEESEFLQCVRSPDGRLLHYQSFAELHYAHNDDAYDAKDGHLVKMCDTLAAFLEAHTSIYNGVSSPHLYEALARIKSECRKQNLGPINVGTLLADFE